MFALLYVLTLARVLFAIGGPEAEKGIRTKASRCTTELKR